MHYEAQIDADDVEILCPDCAEPLAFLKFFVKKRDKGLRHIIAIIGYCHYCKKERHLQLRPDEIRKSGRNEKMSGGVRVILVPLTHVRVLHPSCRDYLENPVEFSFLKRSNAMEVKGRCERCKEDTVSLFTNDGHGSLNLSHFLLRCPTCSYDIFLDNISFQTFSSYSQLVGVGVCSPKCGGVYHVRLALLPQVAPTVKGL